MLHLQKIVGGALDVLADLVAVRVPVQQGPQDEHVERALQQVGALFCFLFCHGRQSTLNLTLMVDIRLSRVNSVVTNGATDST